MQHAEGGFFSSQDADSEGVEGKFFVWGWDELVALVGPAVATCLGAMPERQLGGNERPVAAPGRSDVAAEHEPARSTSWRPRSRTPVGSCSRFASGRVHPATDDKVLTAWNALAIGAFAEAGRAFDEPPYVQEAVRCAEFVLTHLRDDRGRLLRSWRNGTAGRPGFADDHAIMAAACLTLYETTFELRWFEEAVTLADELLRLFHDENEAASSKRVPTQRNSCFARRSSTTTRRRRGTRWPRRSLLRLSSFTGDAAYERAGLSALRLIRDAMSGAPTGFGQALCALDRYLGPSNEVAIVGDPAAADTLALAAVVTNEAYRPNIVLAVAAPGDARAARTVPVLRDRDTRDGLATAYVCERFTCKLPVTDVGALREQLGG